VQYYFHITANHSWEDEKLLTPRSFGENRDMQYEPKDARICVCPSIVGCIVALSCTLPMEANRCVFRTKYKVEAIKPYNVLDAYITGEHWIVEPTTFIRYGNVNLNKLPVIKENGFDRPIQFICGGSGDKGDEDFQRRYMKIFRDSYDEWFSKV